MKQNITMVTVFFKGIAKRDKKEKLHSIRIAELSGHLTLSPDQLNSYERQAWEEIDLRCFKNATRGNISINHGDLEDQIISIALMPTHKQLILR